MVRARIWGGIAVALASCWMGAPASAQFASDETPDVRVIYLDPFQTYLVPHVGRCFENSLTFEHQLLGFTPSQKVTLFLNDFGDMGNASATAIPRDFLSIQTAPISTAYEAVSPNERFNWLLNHEMVHIATTDGAATADKRARAFFGGKVLPNNDDPESILYFYLTAPRASSPGWYLEGIAVFIETWMAGGQGRAQGPYDEMVFRSMVKDGARIYDPLGLVSQGIKTDFQVEVNSYLYGTRFMTYLGTRYSPEKVIEWVSRHDGSKAYFTKNFEAVFGLPLSQAWAEWIEFEKDFQQKNLDAIRKYPVTPAKDLSARALGSISRPIVDEQRRKVYLAFNYPGLVAHIGSVSMDDGTVTPIVEVKGPVLYTVTSLAYDPSAHVLFYTTDNSEFRDLRSLDPETGKSTLLMKDARIGDLVFSPSDRSLWGIRHFNAIATIVNIPYPYKDWKQVYSYPYGEVPYDLDVAQDGALLSASVGQIDGSHAVHVMKTADLLAGNALPSAKFDFGTFIPSSFAFSKDGRYLYGSSYYTGVSNIFRYELATGKTEALSNAETGFFHPVPLDDGSMLVFRFGGEGFVPATIDPKPLEDVSAITFLGAELVEKHPIVKEWKVGSPAKMPYDELTVYRGTYQSFKSVRSESFYPILEGYKESPAAGMRFNFSDPLQLNRFQLNASYSPDQNLPSKERFHVRFQFKRYDWHVDARWNRADFYDLFGPTKVSRKGYGLRVGWDHTLLNDRPRRVTVSVEGQYDGGIDTLPRYQNIASPVDRVASAYARFHFENVRGSLGRVDEEKGQKADLYLSETYIPGAFFPQILATYDVGFQLPLKHSSIWLRSSAGGGTGDPADPFANFFFGGFGNNWLDNGEIHRYRQFYAFPGAELNELGGRTFVKSILEWNLPPIRFSHFGATGLYGTWARTSLFLAGLATNIDRSDLRQNVGDAGAQMDFRFTMLSRLDMTLSFGYAAAFEHGEAPRHEAMVSLKVMQ
jgi:hypothetical protein